MFQELVDNTNGLNIFTHALYPGNKTAYTPDNQLNFDSCPTCFVQFVDHFVGSKTVHLEILVDKTSIETFVGQGTLYSIMPKDLGSEEKGIEFWTIGRENKIIIRNLEIYELKSIWD